MQFSGRRRQAVSAEVVRSTEPYTKKVFPKSDDEKQRLQAFVKDNILFSHLNHEELDEVTDAFFPVSHPPAAVIIKQGDDGDNFYIIDSGECEIFVAASKAAMGSGSESTKVAELSSGGSFGELALMYNAPRAATVTAKTECRLWALDRGTFNHILRNSEQSKRQTYLKFLSNIEVLKNLDEEDMHTLSDAIVEKSFGHDEQIIRQGEKGEEFYIVLEGSAAAIRELADGTLKQLCTFQKGQCFGERSLLTSEPRAASVFARGHCRVGSIEKESFESLLGPCEEVLRKHMAAMGYTAADTENDI